MPLAGDFRLPSELKETKSYPLDLAVCRDCSLVQILNVVSPDVLFTDYRYLSSITQTLSQHFLDYADFLVERVLPRENSFVVEFGCNDGVLLEPLRKRGVQVIGVDAAENVVEVARRRGLDVIHGFFGRAIAAEIAAKCGRPDVVTASNVFAHIDDLDEIMLGVDVLLAEDGTFLVEVHYVVDLLKDFQFDTVYHEHLCYYSLHALQALYSRFDFSIVDVQRLPMHGGSIRVLAKRSAAEPGVSPVVEQMLESERAWGLHTSEPYLQFGDKVRRHREELHGLVHDQKRMGRKISAFGAAGRATILLNYCGLDDKTIDYVVDESPFRIGRYVPGVNIPVVPRARLAEDPSDICLITAWNYRDEILEKERDFLVRGGIFLLPLPTVKFVRIGDVGN
jgi:SAM-dependent methyltransferase